MKEAKAKAKATDFDAVADRIEAEWPASRRRDATVASLRRAAARRRLAEAILRDLRRK